MTVRIDLPSEAENRLRARAEAAGMSVEELLKTLLERELEDGSTSAQTAREDLLGPIAKLPSEAFENLPTDGASQHDHYIYGVPKRDDL